MGNAGSSHPSIKCVVAIDLGTANSGFAYRLERRSNTQFNDKWEDTDYRVKTDILLNSDLTEPLEFGPQASKWYRKVLGIDVNESDVEWLSEEDRKKYADSVLLEKIKLQVLNLKVCILVHGVIIKLLNARLYKCKQ